MSSANKSRRFHLLRTQHLFLRLLSPVEKVLIPSISSPFYSPDLGRPSCLSSRMFSIFSGGKENPPEGKGKGEGRPSSFLLFVIVPNYKVTYATMLQDVTLHNGQPVEVIEGMWSDFVASSFFFFFYSPNCKEKGVLIATRL